MPKDLEIGEKFHRLLEKAIEIGNFWFNSNSIKYSFVMNESISMNFRI